ncbi:MAG: TerB family tellurite resistance protein [Gammaproteobacteria bacterium]|nr:TerB family tellurite resistance protein [Gammaproteobacteria bacterium]
MFDSLKHWLDTLREQSHLFEHADDAVLHAALASVLYHIMSADGRVDASEKRVFDRIMREEFELANDQIDHLYQAAKASNADVHGDLHTINFYLKHNPAVRMTFMQKLLQMIDVHGAEEHELELFYEALHEIFPEVREMRGDADL